jgi:endoglucanase
MALARCPCACPALKVLAGAAERSGMSRSRVAAFALAFCLLLASVAQAFASSTGQSGYGQAPPPPASPGKANHHKHKHPASHHHHHKKKKKKKHNKAAKGKKHAKKHKRKHKRRRAPASVTTAAPRPAIPVTQPSAPAPAPAAPAPTGDPFAGHGFYDNRAEALATENEWAKQGRSADAAEIAKIASTGTAEWFGDWSKSGDAGKYVGAASAAGDLPVLVVYDIPWRDSCSGYSGGGASSPAAYEQFIAMIAGEIASHHAVVILEPDAVPEVECLKSSEREQIYFTLLKGAVAKLDAAGASVYIDAGNAGWHGGASGEAMIASRLQQAGVAGARGFSLNVSNFDATASETAYGEAISHDLGGGPRFIIDTSRNGNGGNGEWCNPRGRALGSPPTAQTGNPLVDAYFWVKVVGQSDGTCNGGPPAGQWWPEYALELAKNASW